MGLNVSKSATLLAIFGTALTAVPVNTVRHTLPNHLLVDHHVGNDRAVNFDDHGGRLALLSRLHELVEMPNDGLRTLGMPILML